jgi:predicted dehydrogenase
VIVTVCDADAARAQALADEFAAVAQTDAAGLLASGQPGFTGIVDYHGARWSL